MKMLTLATTTLLVALLSHSADVKAQPDHMHAEHSSPEVAQPEEHDTHSAKVSETITGDRTVDHSTHRDSRQSEGAQYNFDPKLKEPISPLSVADRAAAFPEVEDHHKHGTRLGSFWLADQLEWSNTDEGREVAWEGIGWIGGDINRVWLRTKGHTLDERLQRARGEILYGRAVHPWWDVVTGIRKDFGDFGGNGGSPRTWAAFGIQGLAPYNFEVFATGYLSDEGDTAAIVEAEYDLLITNRLIANWGVEATWFGQSNNDEVTGSGLSTVEAGIRLRYEFTREFAPYIGYENEWSFGKTSDLRKLTSHSRSEGRWVLGFRFWL
jgi:copper resistance protein B